MNIHTLWTHTRSSGLPFMLRRPRSSWGFGALLKGTSVEVLRVERVLDIHFPTYNSCRPRDSNPQPFDYESDSLIIRPQLPLKSYMIIRNKSVIKDFTFKLLLLAKLQSILHNKAFSSEKVQHSIVLLHQKPSNHLDLFWLVIDAWSVHISLLIQKRLLLNWR